MRFPPIAAGALALVLVLAAPSAASAAVTHEATLTGSLATVTVDVEALNAGQQASVLIMRVGARYSAPSVADIVMANEYTVDAAGLVSFGATLPSGDLDDYVLAVNVAGATERYLASLDPLGPTPVEAAGPGVGLDPAANGGPGSLAATGMNIAVGLLVLFALGLTAAGAILYLRRRRRGLLSEHAASAG